MLHHTLSEVYGEEVAAILAKPLMWALFEDIITDSNHIPISICNRVVMAYNNLPERLPNDQNPIKKIQIIAWGDDADVHLDEVPNDLAQGAWQGNAMPQQSRDEQMLAIYGRVAAMDQKQDDFYSEY